MCTHGRLPRDRGGAPAGVATGDADEARVALGTGALRTINCHEVYAFVNRPHDGLCQPDTELEFPAWPGPGDGVARPGDWIVRGRDGEHFPVPAAEFTATYEQL